MVLVVSIRACDEVIAMTNGLGVQEHAIEDDGHDTDKTELAGRINRARRCLGIIWQDQSDCGEYNQHAQIHVGAGDLKVLLAIAQAADQNADADKAIAHDHHHGEHGVARQRRNAVLTQHNGCDQRDFDDRHGHGQQQRAERLPDHLGNHLGMMDRSEDCSEQNDQQHYREDHARWRACEAYAQPGNFGGGIKQNSQRRIDPG